MSETRHKIILVDDNLSTLNQGKMLLQKFYQVLTVPSAAKLFANLEHIIPDIILLDVEMPDMDGFETIMKLKADPRFKDIPVMFLTSKSDEDSERKGFSLGAVDYIAKPFSAPLLQKRISNQILYKRVQTAVEEHSSALEVMENTIIEEVKRTEIAEASNRAKVGFLALMSQEIRTPMNSIIGFTELALDDEISSKTKRYLTKIMESSKLLLQVVTDIFEISEIEAGSVELSNVALNLDEIFAKCRAEIMPKILEKGLEVEISTEPTPGKTPLGDPKRLLQVLTSLISNVVKFANAGTILVESKVKTVSEQNITMHFEVSSACIGMTSEQIHNILDPFTVVETGMSLNYGVTGLGMAITKDLVRMMGGELIVKSTPGVGSYFSFDLVFETE
jgi:signal transduction histidine kinase